MKTKTICTLLLILFSSALVARERISLNRDWQFHAGYLADRGSKKQVNLPHTWNNMDALAADQTYYRGLSDYTKEIIIDNKHKGKRLFLCFEGSSIITNVFFNNKHVKEHRGGYSAFNVEITDRVKFGEKNRIFVKVNNAPQLDVIPLDGDFNIYGGIYRDVSLLVLDPVCISPLHYATTGVYVTPSNISKEQAQINAKVLLSSRETQSKQVEVVFALCNNGKEQARESVKIDLAAGSDTHADFEFKIAKPHLWNGVKDPFLYQAVATVFVDGKQVDSVVENIGIRTFSIDSDKGFFLNGECLKLRGVCRHQDRAQLGNAISTVHHDEDMALIQEMGANSIRLSHYPQAKYFHNLLDKTGLVAWAEIPLVGEYVNTPAAHANTLEQMTELIYQNYNHPSIMFWGMFNEINAHRDNPLEFLKQLDKHVYSIDSTRLTTAATNTDDPINFVSSLICWNRYDGWYYGEPKNVGSWADGAHKAFPKARIGISEYGAGGSIYQHQDTLERTNIGSMWHPENWQTYYHMENWKAISQRDFLWGSFIWNMFDFAVAGRREGDLAGRNDKGLITYDRKEKKDAFYFYKANWNKEDKFVHIAERRNTVREREITNIMVFSNEREVELIINGKKQGRIKPDQFATFLWKNISLNKGENVVEAISTDGSSDKCIWVR